MTVATGEFKVVQCTQCGRRNRVPAAASGVPRCGNCKTVLPWIADADDESYGAVVESSKLPVLLDLWAPWCGPCRIVSPVLEKLAAKYAGKIKLAKVNVDQSPRTQARFEVQGIPTLIVLKDGKVIERQTGASPEPALSEWLKKALAKTA
jgi:thioredoxin 2